jgi:hypothetical protein
MNNKTSYYSEIYSQMPTFFLNILTVKDSRSGGSTTFQSPEAVTVNDEVMRPDTCILGQFIGE